MRSRKPVLLLCATVLLALAACSGGDDGEAGGDEGGGGATDIPGIEETVELNDPSGDEAVPVLSWEKVSGAETYVVSVFDARGAAYWVWEGAATSVPLGGGDEAADAGSGGPTAGEGFEWMVTAFDGRGKPVAVSERERLSA